MSSYENTYLIKYGLPALAALNAGQTWKARAVGTRYAYTLKKQKGSTPRIGGTVTWSTVETSGRLSAFNPSSTSIACGL